MERDQSGSSSNNFDDVNYYINENEIRKKYPNLPTNNSNIHADDMGYPPYYLMNDATFYFKNSNGKIITKKYSYGT